jgi:hypothetical protein
MEGLCKRALIAGNIGMEFRERKKKSEQNAGSN